MVQTDSAKKTALVILAPGFEEIEALVPVDLLRRAGMDVTLAGLGATCIEGSHKIRVQADCMLETSSSLHDVLVLPGGPGSKVLGASALVKSVIMAHCHAGKLLAAICAAPALVLYPLGLLAGKRFTCYPGMEQGLGEGHFVPAPCVQDGRILTARGVGAAADFSLAIISDLLGKEAALEIHHATVQLSDAPICDRQ